MERDQVERGEMRRKMLDEHAGVGRRAWMLATDNEEEWESEIGSLRLLPQYDSYVLGCGPREWVVPQAARTRVSTYGRGRFEGATAFTVSVSIAPFPQTSATGVLVCGASWCPYRLAFGVVPCPCCRTR